MILTHGANSLSRGGGDFVEIGGRRYKVVKIGNQLWMAENLDYDFCNVGGQTDVDVANAWYFYNDELTYGWNGYKCGLLYNWHAVKYLDDNKSTLLPDGWHVPSYTEFDAFAAACGGASTAGTKLKALDGSAGANWPSGWNGTDDYGFKLLPGGWLYTGTFHDVGAEADFWLREESSSTLANAWYCNRSESITHVNNANKKAGFSLRLVKDAT